MQLFKIRASQVNTLLAGKDDNKLNAGAITYIETWYSEQMYKDKEEIHSKYLDKGNYCENESIDIIAERLNLGILFKNEQHFENEYMTGTPDMITDDLVLDAKNSWSGKSFLQAITSEIDKDYYAQLQVYMHLTGKKKAILCYTLLDTPEDVNYGNEIVYSNPIDERFYYFEIDYSESFIQKVETRVKLCREYLIEYDNKIKSLFAKLNKPKLSNINFTKILDRIKNGENLIEKTLDYYNLSDTQEKLLKASQVLNK
jgi:hypothetical protein